MTAAEYTAVGIPVADNPLAILKVEAALDWMKENTTLKIDEGSAESISALPSCAKLFVVQFTELLSIKQGVASQSIEGLSMSYFESNQNTKIWQLANTLLKGYIKSQVRVFPAKRRW